MQDHDQRFKTLIREFFAEFLELFFSAWAARLDLAHVDWLDKEVFPDPPDGARRALDLVARVATREVVPGFGNAEHWLALVHIEIESPDKMASLRRRVFRSYGYLRDEHQLPVLPIGLFLRVGLEGVGEATYEERFWEFCPIQFRFLYVGLPALDAVQYVQGDNWLGVALAALMRIPKDRAAWLGAEALRRIQSAPLNDQQRFLLGECVQAYLPLDDQQQQEFEKLIATDTYRGVQAMNTTWYEKGIEKGIEMNTTSYEKGIEKGIEKGRRLLLREQLEEQFGVLSPDVSNRIETLPADEVIRVGKAVLNANSLRELGLEE